MTSRPPVYHPFGSHSDQSAEVRRLLQEANDLLQASLPDTFLGRKTFEPFPWDAERRPLGNERRFQPELRTREHVAGQYAESRPAADLWVLIHVNLAADLPEHAHE